MSLFGKTFCVFGARASAWPLAPRTTMCVLVHTSVLSSAVLTILISLLYLVSERQAKPNTIPTPSAPPANAPRAARRACGWVEVAAAIFIQRAFRYIRHVRSIASVVHATLCIQHYTRLFLTRRASSTPAPLQTAHHSPTATGPPQPAAQLTAPPDPASPIPPNEVAINRPLEESQLPTVSGAPTDPPWSAGTDRRHQLEKDKVNVLDANHCITTETLNQMRTGLSTHPCTMSAPLSAFITLAVLTNVAPTDNFTAHQCGRLTMTTLDRLDQLESGRFAGGEDEARGPAHMFGPLRIISFAVEEIQAEAQDLEDAGGIFDHTSFARHLNGYLKLVLAGGGRITGVPDTFASAFPTFAFAISVSIQSGEAAFCDARMRQTYWLRSMRSQIEAEAADGDAPPSWTWRQVTSICARNAALPPPSPLPLGLAALMSHLHSPPASTPIPTTTPAHTSAPTPAPAPVPAPAL